MVVEICPNCQQRYSRDLRNTDYVHSCNFQGNAVIEEDVKQIGTWDDYTGSKTIGDGVPFTAGFMNKFAGQRGGIEGERQGDLSPRGVNKEVYRQRKHLEFIDKSEK